MCTYIYNIVGGYGATGFTPKSLPLSTDWDFGVKTFFIGPWNGNKLIRAILQRDMELLFWVIHMRGHFWSVLGCWNQILYFFFFKFICFRFLMIPK